MSDIKLFRIDNGGVQELGGGEARDRGDRTGRASYMGYNS